MSLNNPSAEATDTGACACGGCGCGAQAPGEQQTVKTEAAPADAVNLLATAPVGPAAEEGDIDARTIPHEVRHARIISMVSALVPGEQVIVAASHLPQRLLNEIDIEVQGAFTFTVLADGPDLWRVAITRDSCC